MSPETPQPAILIPQLIVGLGNPGTKYAGTRHNVGFDAIDAIAKLWQVPLTEQKKFTGEFGEALVGQEKIRLLKPLTYMNLSGQAMRSVTDWYKLEPTRTLMIYDDMDLPLGKIRLRLSGSAGGHNGVKSAIAHLGTQNIPRLRIGIGSPKTANTPDKNAVSHVLGKFSTSEKDILAQVLQLVTEAIELSLKQGVEKAMSLYNGRAVPGVESVE